MQAKNFKNVTDLAERLQILVDKRFKGIWAEFMRAAGINPGAGDRYKKGKGKPSFDQIIQICNVGGVNLEWLMTGQGRMSQSYAAGDGSREAGGGGEVLPDKGEYLYVPLYEVEAAAGHGHNVLGEDIIDFLAFKNWWVRTELKSNPGDLAVIFVQGDSMEPTLSDGDVVLVDRSRNQLTGEGMYVFRMENMLFIKRLQVIGADLLHALSDNPAYKALEFRPSEVDQNFSIIGRVVWAGRRF